MTHAAQSQAPALTEVTSGVWMASEPVRIVGTRLTSNMTVLRLSGEELLLHSPVPMTAERRAAVEQLGQVTHLYAPNTFHHTWLGDWSAAFPAAKVHAPAALGRKRPDLRIDRAHGSAPEPAFAATVVERHIDGFRLDETALYYEPARALVVADLVHHVGRPQDWWTIAYTRMMGFYDRIALSRALQWSAFSDRRAARRSIDALLEQPFERLLVGHGTPIEATSRESLASAYRFLPPAAPLALAGASRPIRRWFAGGACG